MRPVPVHRGIIRQPPIPNRVARCDAVSIRLRLAAQRQKDIAIVRRCMRVAPIEVDILPQRLRCIRCLPRRSPPPNPPPCPKFRTYRSAAVAGIVARRRNRLVVVSLLSSRLQYSAPDSSSATPQPAADTGTWLFTNGCPVAGLYSVTGVVTPSTVCVNPKKSPLRCASVGTVPYKFVGVVFRCPVTFKNTNCSCSPSSAPE